jgi:hypothetical protein
MENDDAMDHGNEMRLNFRCPPELAPVLPRPVPAVRGLPGWFKAMPTKAFDATMGDETLTVKKCPPFVDAMIYGYLIPLVTDLHVRDGEFTWNFELEGAVGEYTQSPIGFHDPGQVAGAPFADEDRFIIKFNSFWTIEAPPGYSLLFTHPFNRADLPFTTLTGLVDCDAFHHSALNFPARWHDMNFEGVLPKGTPVAQCVPVKRESWSESFETLSSGGVAQMAKTRLAIAQEIGVYRRQFRAPKR